MTWLGEWLKEIVFVVLLAIFVELMLPSKSMQRYVKLVLSLLVLLTLLDPLLEVLSQNPLQKLQNAIEAQFKPVSNDQSLERILQEGERLRLSQEQDAKQWAAGEVASQMKQQLAAGTSLNIDKVAVTLKVTKVQNKQDQNKQGEVQAEYDQPSISSVQVYLKPTGKKEQAVMAEGEGGDEAASPPPDVQIKVPAIDKVQVNIGSGNPGTTADSDLPQTLQAGGALPSKQQADKADAQTAGTPPENPPAEDEAAVAAPESEETNKATQLLGGSWGIDPGIIHFYVTNPGTTQ